MNTKDARFLTKPQQESLRRRAVRAVLEEKLQQKEVARLFGVCEYSISKWVRAFKANGEKALAIKPQGRPATGGRLKHKYWLDFQRNIVTKKPKDFDIPSTIWDLKSIGALLSKNFSVILSKSGISDLLSKMGFSAQRPSYRAYQRNKKKVNIWLNETYPAIKKKPKQKMVKSSLAMKPK